MSCKTIESTQGENYSGGGNLTGDIETADIHILSYRRRPELATAIAVLLSYQRWVEQATPNKTHQITAAQTCTSSTTSGWSHPL